MNNAALINIVFASLLGVAANGLAQASDVHRAHTHGVANATLAFESGSMEMQFESPAMSLLGFEHRPNTQQQIDMAEKTKAFLANSENVLSINGADCYLSHSNVNILGPAGKTLASNETTKGEHHVHKKHGQQQAHGHESHGDNHSEVSAHYQFDCANGQAPKSVAILLFKRFPNLEKIEVNWVTETQQGKSVLRSQASEIELK